MIVNLDGTKNETVIEVPCRRKKGKVVLKFVDVDTGELIETEIIEDLDLGEHEILPNLNNEKYEIIEVEKKELMEEEIKTKPTAKRKRNSPPSIFANMEEFRKSIEKNGVED